MLAYGPGAIAVATGAAGAAAFLATPPGLAIAAAAALIGTANYIYKAVRHIKHAKAKNERKTMLDSMQQIGKLTEYGLKGTKGRNDKPIGIDVRGHKLLEGAVRAYNDTIRKADDYLPNSRTSGRGTLIPLSNVTYKDLVTIGIVHKEGAYSDKPRFDLTKLDNKSSGLGGFKLNHAANTLDKLKEHKGQFSNWMGRDRGKNFENMNLKNLSFDQMLDFYDATRLDLVGRDSQAAAEEIYDQLLDDYQTHMEDLSDNSKKQNKRDKPTEDHAAGDPADFKLRASGYDTPFSDAYHNPKVKKDKIRNAADFLHAMNVSKSDIRTMIQSSINPSTGQFYRPEDLIDPDLQGDQRTVALKAAQENLDTGRAAAIAMIKKAVFEGQKTSAPNLNADVDNE